MMLKFIPNEFKRHFFRYIFVLVLFYFFQFKITNSKLGIELLDFSSFFDGLMAVLKMIFHKASCDDVLFSLIAAFVVYLLHIYTIKIIKFIPLRHFVTGDYKSKICATASNVDANENIANVYIGELRKLMFYMNITDYISLLTLVGLCVLILNGDWVFIFAFIFYILFIFFNLYIFYVKFYPRYIVDKKMRGEIVDY